MGNLIAGRIVGSNNHARCRGSVLTARKPAGGWTAGMTVGRTQPHMAADDSGPRLHACSLSATRGGFPSGHRQEPPDESRRGRVGRRWITIVFIRIEHDTSAAGVISAQSGDVRHYPKKGAPSRRCPRVPRTRRNHDHIISGRPGPRPRVETAVASPPEHSEISITITLCHTQDAKPKQGLVLISTLEEHFYRTRYRTRPDRTGTRLVICT
ncbi:hypothetical protein FDG2_1742 [Candidatus Protofrankia californiensis]|uniref:Uncharacterized protein n=1 Tax=Candidatus Protofrankia californiensis TaxID=1839754 RepID=A0A1C3NW87_9ACTN|nr:hypothetical protein FDG2_1742 [Candidatus Protofrankia californiensis]